MILRIMQVKAALMRGVDVDLTNTAGWTALHAAAAGGHTKILDVLLRAEAQRVAAHSDGLDPRHVV